MTCTPALLVVTGLQREAQIAAGEGVVTLCSGGRSRRCWRRSPCAMRSAAAATRAAVLSFGLAGGLAPDLQPGDVVDRLARMSGTATPLTTRPRLARADRLRDVGKRDRVHRGAARGSAIAFVTQSADKAALHAATGRARSRYGISYRSGLRARSMACRSPPSARSAIRRHAACRTSQRMRCGPTATSILRKCLRRCCGAPGQIPALIAAGIDSERAFAVVTPRSPSSWPALRPRRRGFPIASSAPATRTRIRPGAAYPSRFPAPSVRTCGCRAATPTAPSAGC